MPPHACTRRPSAATIARTTSRFANEAVEREVEVDDVRPSRARCGVRARGGERVAVERRSAGTGPAGRVDASRPPATSIAGITSKPIGEPYRRPVAPATSPYWGMDMPVFALHTVLFPVETMALRVFEERYRVMMDEVLPDGAFVVVAIREGREVGGAYEPYRVGVTVGDRGLRDDGDEEDRTGCASSGGTASR